MSQQATYLYRAIFAHNIINITFFQNAKSCRKIKKTFIFWNEMNWNTLIKENIFMRYICFPMENNYMLKSYICKKNFLLGCSVRILRTQIFWDFVPSPICTHDIRTSLDPLLYVICHKMVDSSTECWKICDISQAGWLLKIISCPEFWRTCVRQIGVRSFMTPQPVYACRTQEEWYPSPRAA